MHIGLQFLFRVQIVPNGGVDQRDNLFYPLSYRIEAAAFFPVEFIRLGLIPSFWK
ncbi:hypothetical protein L539_3638 [Bordetella hinzii 5132]|nr:hypothetical protein L539_3638 [Bordetella hinzii 5132]